MVTESFSINPWKTLTDFADEDERINYDYSEDINYQGMFGQVEYTEDTFSVFSKVPYPINRIKEKIGLLLI